MKTAVSSNHHILESARINRHAVMKMLCN